jgi:hypothetical protein
VCAVFSDKALLVGGNIFFWEDGADRASRNASATVNALVWVDVELVVAFIDALDGANFDAGAIFGSNAGLGNHMSHFCILLGKRLKRSYRYFVSDR